MVERKYTPFTLSERGYSELTESQKLQLFDIQSSQSNELQLWPCRVVLKNGKSFDNVYIVEAKKYINQWGIWPEDDPNKKSIAISDVDCIEESPNRLPAYFANKMYTAGETGMGYIIFTIQFSDGSEKTYIGGNAIDFIELPADKIMSDIIDVKPHEGRKGIEQFKSSEFFWCLFDK